MKILTAVLALLTSHGIAAAPGNGVPVNAGAGVRTLEIQPQQKDDDWVRYGGQQPVNEALRGPAGAGPQWPAVYEIRTVMDPITDERILPRSDYRRNTEAKNVIALVVSPGELEPASFVLTAGNADLRDVTITAGAPADSDNGQVLSNMQVDIRLVKVWYQSGKRMRRTRGEEKQFVPELLVKDAGMVQVDEENQLNRVRIRPALRDAESLLPFTVPRNTNQQIWITVSAPPELESGLYRGAVHVAFSTDGRRYDHELELRVRVLPFRLMDHGLEYGLFYLGRIFERNAQPSYTARKKTKVQAAAEIADMRAHGISMIGVDHFVDKTSNRFDISGLETMLRLMREHGYSRFTYVDWNVAGHDDRDYYKKKIQKVSTVANNYGFGEVWIYNRDEKTAEVLERSGHTFHTARKFGAKNVVAVIDGRTAEKIARSLDVAIIKVDSPRDGIARLKKAGLKVLAYGVPHAGEENPETTRHRYGLGLIDSGFDGAFLYAYQSGDCWDDWMKWGESHYRPNVLAYPTVDRPIPTLQWEALREGIDDVRYLATYLHYAKENGLNTGWLSASLARERPGKIRERIVSELDALGLESGVH